MAENNKVTRNAMGFVKTKRGWQWRMHDHTGAVIAASTQYYASQYAAKRAANRAAVRMHAYGVKAGLVYASAPNTAARLNEGAQALAKATAAHGNSSNAAPVAVREEAKPAPRKRFGLFGRG